MQMIAGAVPAQYADQTTQPTSQYGTFAGHSVSNRNIIRQVVGSNATEGMRHSRSGAGPAALPRNMSRGLRPQQQATTATESDLMIIGDQA